MEIGGIGSYDDSPLFCHTNRPPDGATSGGDWWAPDGTRVSQSAVPGFTRTRGPMVVRLQRTSRDPQDGIYQCTVDDAASTPQIVYAGLYNTRGSYNLSRMVVLIWMAQVQRHRFSMRIDIFHHHRVAMSDIHVCLKYDKECMGDV